MSKAKRTDSVIVQVDEATKGIMESITAGLTSEISEPLLEIRSDINNISDEIGILTKMTSAASAQAKKQSTDIAEKTDDILYEVNQLSKSIATLRKEQKALKDSVAGIEKKLDIIFNIIDNMASTQ